MKRALVHEQPLDQPSAASECQSFREANATSNNSSDYSFYDRLRRCLVYLPCDGSNTSCLQASQHRLAEGSNVIQVETKKLGIKNEAEQIRLMHLAVMIPIEIFEGLDFVIPFTIAIAKASLMAAYHFNNRLSAVVTDLEDEQLQSCNIKMTLDFFDTKLSPIEAARVLDRHVHKREFPYQTTAVVGGASSSVSSQMAILNAIHQIPQVSYASSSSDLDNKGAYPLFGRVISSNDANAIAAVDYLHDSLNVTHFGILYVRNSYGTAYGRALQVEAANRHLTTVSYAIPPSFGGEGMSDAMALLKESGFRYFVAVIFDSALVSFLNEANNAGIIGPDYFWMLAENADSSSLALLTLPEKSPLVDAAYGLAFLSRSVDFESDSFLGFLKEWDAFDDDVMFREYFASKSPLASNISFSATYMSYISEVVSSEIYDSVMSLGLSACRTKEPFFNGTELFETFRRLTFEGATSYVEIDPISGSRKHQTSTFIIKNVMPNEPDANGNIRFKTTKAMEYKLRPCDDYNISLKSWRSIDNIPFMYSGRTTIPPIFLPPVVLNTNDVEPWLLVSGLTLGVIVMIAAASFGFWTWYHRNSPVVQRSQPLFLGILCAGVFLMTTTMFSLASRSPPIPIEHMDFWCMYGYWAYAIGFALAFSALVSKLRRVNMIVQNQYMFRRIVVKPRDVMLPGVFIISCNVLVLTIWNVLAPLKYMTEYKDTTFDRFGRPTDWAGSCRTPEGDIPAVIFTGLILAINFVALVFANIEAYNARSVNTEYCESLYVGCAMAVLLQFFVIACPLLLIQSIGPQASYLFRTILVIASSASTLGLIFIPKVSYYYYDLRENNKMEARELEVIDEEDDEQDRGIRIVSVNSAVEIENVAQLDEDINGIMRIVRRPVQPRSRRARNRPRSGRDALYSRTKPQNQEDRKPRQKKIVYKNAAPTADMACFAMTAM